MTPERINAATKGGEKRTEKLTSKLPVYLGDLDGASGRGRDGPVPHRRVGIDARQATNSRASLLEIALTGPCGSAMTADQAGES